MEEHTVKKCNLHNFAPQNFNNVQAGAVLFVLWGGLLCDRRRMSAGEEPLADPPVPKPQRGSKPERRGL